MNLLPALKVCKVCHLRYCLGAGGILDLGLVLLDNYSTTHVEVFSSSLTYFLFGLAQHEICDVSGYCIIILTARMTV